MQMDKEKYLEYYKTLSCLASDQEQNIEGKVTTEFFPSVHLIHTGIYMTFYALMCPRLYVIEYVTDLVKTIKH